jgi:hypothetical protein
MEILVLGDSHAQIFSSQLMQMQFPHVNFSVVAVDGATVSGLPNPNSVTQSMPRFEAAMLGSTAQKVIVMLGEVDVGFVIWYRAQKYAESIRSMLMDTVVKYEHLLLRIASNSEVICISAPLPTIQDGIPWGGDVANARKEVVATQFEKTVLTQLFNAHMHFFCIQSGMQYVLLDQDSMGESGLIKESLRNKNRGDHHYDASEHVQLLTKHLHLLLTES